LPLLAASRMNETTRLGGDCEISVFTKNGQQHNHPCPEKHVPSRTTFTSANIRTIRPELIKRQRCANLVGERRSQGVRIQVEHAQSWNRGKLRGNRTCQLIHIQTNGLQCLHTAKLSWNDSSQYIGSQIDFCQLSQSAQLGWNSRLQRVQVKVQVF
jgi:hypothetical protein